MGIFEFLILVVVVLIIIGICELVDPGKEHNDPGHGGY